MQNFFSGDGQFDQLVTGADCGIRSVPVAVGQSAERERGVSQWLLLQGGDQD